MKWAKRLFPILGWIPWYNRTLLKEDLAAGFTVAVVLIPQGLAYAVLAGLPPVYGLYASLVPPLLYVLFGTSRQLSIGPVAMDSLMVAAGISVLAAGGTAEYIELSILLAFCIGAVQAMLGLFRMGFITNLLSRPVLSGFTSAVAVIIAVNQLKNFLGVDLSGGNNTAVIVGEAIGKWSEVHLLTLGIGLTGIGIIIGTKVLNPKFPGALLAVVLGVLVVYLIQLDGRGVEIVGAIPEGLPQVKWPAFSVTSIKKLLPLTFTLALVSYIEAFSIAKVFESKKRDHKVFPNKELIALGVSNLVGALFHSFPVSGGFSRSAVNFQAGARTQIATVVSAGLVGITLLFLTPLFYYLPQVVLSAIILVGVASLVDIRYLRDLYGSNKTEFALAVATLLITLHFGLIAGLVSGVAISLVLLIYRMAYPHVAVLGRIPGHHEFRNLKRFPNLEHWENLLIVRVDAPLLFVNIQYVRDFIEEYLHTHPEVEVVLLDGASVSQVDATALQGLRDFHSRLKELNVKLAFAELIGPVRDVLAHSDLIGDIREHVFLDLNEAVNFLTGKEGPRYGKEALQAND